MIALRLEVEQGIEGGNAVDLRTREIDLPGQVVQDRDGQVFVLLAFLNLLENAQQHPRAILVPGDQAIDELLILLMKVHFFGHGWILHEDSLRAALTSR